MPPVVLLEVLGESLHLLLRGQLVRRRGLAGRRCGGVGGVGGKNGRTRRRTRVRGGDRVHGLHGRGGGRRGTGGGPSRRARSGSVPLPAEEKGQPDAEREDQHQPPQVAQLPRGEFDEGERPRENQADAEQHQQGDITAPMLSVLRPILKTNQLNISSF